MKEEEFDPSTSEAFQKNLDKVFEELMAEKEPVPLDTSVEDDFQWIDIDKEIKKGAEKENTEEEKRKENGKVAEMQAAETVEEAAATEEPTQKPEILAAQKASEAEKFDEVPSMSAEEEEKLLQGINEALAAQIANEFA